MGLGSRLRMWAMVLFDDAGAIPSCPFAGL